MNDPDYDYDYSLVEYLKTDSKLQDMWSIEDSLDKQEDIEKEIENIDNGVKMRNVLKIVDNKVVIEKIENPINKLIR